jgi:hypothetical protein
MRIVTIALGAGLALVLASVSHAPAQTTTVKKEATGAASTAGATRTTTPVKKPKTPLTGVVGPKATTVAPLTEAECEQLGGTVHSESVGICNSGKYCGRRDENGKAHRVCISVSK